LWGEKGFWYGAFRVRVAGYHNGAEKGKNPEGGQKSTPKVPEIGQFAAERSKGGEKKSLHSLFTAKKREETQTQH